MHSHFQILFSGVLWVVRKKSWGVPLFRVLLHLWQKFFKIFWGYMRCPLPPLPPCASMLEPLFFSFCLFMQNLLPEFQYFFLNSPLNISFIFWNFVWLFIRCELGFVNFLFLGKRSFIEILSKFIAYFDNKEMAFCSFFWWLRWNVKYGAVRLEKIRMSDTI